MSTTASTTRIVALCNQKGGVGKTMLTAGLAEVLTDRGLRVLVIDADPQANLTAQLGCEDPEFTLNDVLTPDPVTRLVGEGVIGEAFMRAGSAWTGDGDEPDRALEVVASELGLASREQDQDLGREFRLRRALAGVADRWDVVLVDCPPSLGQLTINALIAADSVLLVTEARAASAEGLAQMVRTLGAVQGTYNPGLRLAGIAVNRYREDRTDRRAWAAQLREHYGPALIEAFIPEREAVAKAATAGEPLGHFGQTASVLHALGAVADRIVKD